LDAIPPVLVGALIGAGGTATLRAAGTLEEPRPIRIGPDYA